jgi:hypothetical protein
MPSSTLLIFAFSALVNWQALIAFGDRRHWRRVRRVVVIEPGAGKAVAGLYRRSRHDSDDLAVYAIVFSPNGIL